MPNDNEALSAAGSTVLFREWRVSPNILKMSNNKMNAVTLKPQSNKSDDSSLSYYCLFCKFAHDDCWDFLVGRENPSWINHYLVTCAFLGRPVLVSIHPIRPHLQVCMSALCHVSWPISGRPRRIHDLDLNVFFQCGSHPS